MQSPLSNLDAEMAAFLLSMRERGYVATIVLLNMNDPTNYKFASTLGEEKPAIELLRRFVDGFPRATQKSTRTLALDKAAV